MRSERSALDDHLGAYRARHLFGDHAAQGGRDEDVHVGGEEVPAHDPKLTPGLASTYILDATPGRHTQGGELLAPVELELDDVDPYAYSGAAENHTKLVNIMHVVNAAGLCMFGYLSYPAQCIPDQLSAVTGWDFDMEEVYKTGKRIGTMRHAFNLREGHNPLTRNVPGRLVGDDSNSAMEWVTARGVRRAS